MHVCLLTANINNKQVVLMKLFFSFLRKSSKMMSEDNVKLQYILYKFSDFVLSTVDFLNKTMLMLIHKTIFVNLN